MQVLTSMTERISVAAAATRDAYAAWKLERDQRDDLIVEAIDSGELSQRAAATAAGTTVQNIARILAKPEPADRS